MATFLQESTLQLANSGDKRLGSRSLATRSKQSEKAKPPVGQPYSIKENSKP